MTPGQIDPPAAVGLDAFEQTVLEVARRVGSRLDARNAEVLG